MANHPSAEKRNRQRQKRTVRNKAIISAVRTSVRSARASLVEGDGKAAGGRVQAAASALSRAASKGVVHPKTAARATSRMARALAKLAK